MYEYIGYIEEVLKNIDCTNEEKEDMHLEFHDHLNELKNEYIQQANLLMKLQSLP